MGNIHKNCDGLWAGWATTSLTELNIAIGFSQPIVSLSTVFLWVSNGRSQLCSFFSFYTLCCFMCVILYSLFSCFRSVYLYLPVPSQAHVHLCLCFVVKCLALVLCYITILSVVVVAFFSLFLVSKWFWVPSFFLKLAFFTDYRAKSFSVIAFELLFVLGVVLLSL